MPGDGLGQNRRVSSSAPSQSDADALVDRVARFVENPDPEAFPELALAAFAFQYERIAPFRRLCQGRGIRPGSIEDWRRIPAVPAAAFQTLELATAPAVEVFRSSGTTGGPRSVHRHPYPELYRRVVDATFPACCLDAAQPRPPMLSLIPTRRQTPDSSLGFMVDHVLARFGARDSCVAFGTGGVEVERATRWCAARQRDGRAPLILATTFALVEWLDGLAEQGRALRLPAGTTVFETGGGKGRTREVSPREVLGALERRLGVAAGRVVREYGMTELTSQFYTRRGGDPEVFVGPPWLMARLLDPITLAEAAPGQTGILVIFDLANLGSAVHLLTQDLGMAAGEGFRLLGRAAGAELRGCSLAVEELAAGGDSR